MHCGIKNLDKQHSRFEEGGGGVLLRNEAPFSLILCPELSTTERSGPFPRPDAVRLLVTPATKVDIMIICMLISCYALWLRSILPIPMRNLHRSSGHKPSVRRSERTTPHEGHVSGRPKTDQTRMRFIYQRKETR